MSPRPSANIGDLVWVQDPVYSRILPTFYNRVVVVKRYFPTLLRRCYVWKLAGIQDTASMRTTDLGPLVALETQHLSEFLWYVA
jgi:hypothetical protein